MINCLMILAIFIVIGGIVTNDPTVDIVATTVTILYFIPALVVLVAIAIVTTPISWIMKIFKKGDDSGA